MKRAWLGRRTIAGLELIPGFGLAWLGAQIVPRVLPWLPWGLISPYTVGAIISTAFNLVLWDFWVKVVILLAGPLPVVSSERRSSLPDS
jgi:hypothetical protein